MQEAAAQAGTFEAQQDLITAALASWQLPAAPDGAAGWGADIARSAAAPLLQLDLTVRDGRVQLSPPLEEAEAAVLGTFDALCFSTFTDPYKALAIMGYGADAAMVLPARDDPRVAEHRSEVQRIVRAALRPLQHLQRSFDAQYGGVVAQKLGAYAEQWRAAEPDALLQELQRLRQVCCACRSCINASNQIQL